MSVPQVALEDQLNDFDPAKRRSALDALLAQVEAGNITFPEPQPMVNIHAHTFFSFNGYGYSPTYFAWKARCEGLRVAGIVDFDVLDAVDEFLEAANRLNLRGCAGIETRVFVPEFADKVINSPGEPGIAYYMGIGFTSKESADPVGLAELKDIAQGRNRSMLERVNPALAPVTLDYETDVLPFTPAGNATERHLCMAFDAKARTLFPNEDDLVAFWYDKLGVDADTVRKALQSGPDMQGLIRSKTMKAGGVGYVQPEGPDFPLLTKVAKFAADAGAIPTFTYLDGTSDGEQEMERLLDVCMKAGSAAVNIVPDRNWNISDPKVKAQKVKNFDEFVAMAQERNLPIAVGTEMNAHGLRFVDDFSAPEMQKHAAEFLKGAHILFAHTQLQAAKGMGYLSDWAAQSFRDTAAKNAFFETVGQRLEPRNRAMLEEIGPDMAPDAVLDTLAS